MWICGAEIMNQAGENSRVTGILILAGTPIGDSRDASLRLREVLVDADVIAAEDTRRFHTLAARLGIETTAPLVSYFEGNESERTPRLISDLEDGKTVVLVTDAGMPSISDPGYRLVKAAIDAEIPITVVPGPSAVLTALALSGLPVDRFTFEGFAPRKTAERKHALAELAEEQRTMVFFEAPHRLADFLTTAAEVFGSGRKAAVAREMTKPYEEVKRGSLGDLAEWAKENARGEICIVISGAEKPALTLTEAIHMVQRRVSEGEKLSSAVSEVAGFTGIRRKDLYTAALQAR